jgi:fumarate reductase subunit C
MLRSIDSGSLTADAGFADRPRKSRWPARLDLAQSASGLILVLFLWGHMFFVSSILLGKDAMWTITKFFEGYYFFGVSYPWIVSIVVALGACWDAIVRRRATPAQFA